LLIRRQPGLAVMSGVAEMSGCASPVDFIVAQDVVLLLNDGACPVVEQEDDDT
jgi:hypothetical protein